MSNGSTIGNYEQLFFEAVANGDLIKLKAIIPRINTKKIINLKTRSGDSLLHLVAHGNHAKLVKILVESGADLNATNNKGMTPIHLASWEARPEVLLALIEVGADVDARIEHTETPLFYASVSAAYNSTIRPLNRDKSNMLLVVIEILVNNNANVNTTNSEGVTPLHMLAATTFENDDLEKSYANLIRLLINCGANVNSIDNRGRLPLHVATKHSQTHAMKALIDAGSELNIKDIEGNTPLFYASIKNNSEIPYRILVRAGADEI